MKGCIVSSKPGKLKSRLGRGLSSLISVSDPEEMALAEEPAGELAEAPAAPAPTFVEVETPVEPPTSGLLDLPIELVDPNPHQPRRVFDDAALAELAASLKGTGLIQPIVVRRVGDRYQLIAGERRWRAAKLAELESLPALLREADDIEQAQMALVENIQRQDLNPIDRANAYKTLLAQLGLTQAGLATRLGEDRSHIAHFLRLLELSPQVQDLVRDSKLSMGHAKVLAGVQDRATQDRLAQLAISQDLSVRSLEKLTQDPTSVPVPSSSKEAPATSAHIQQLEKSLSRQLGLRVQVRQGAKKSVGKLVLHYGSLDQFDELMTRLGVSAD
jgi:ParB family chromosome partitioning protein